MSALTVLVQDGAADPGDIPAVLASLPESLRPFGDGPEPADLVAVAGGPGWTARSVEALADGVRGVLVIDPVSEDVTRLRDDARRYSVPVVVARPYAGNPAIAVVAPYFAGAEWPELLEARLVVPVGADLAHALLDQLALVTAAAGALERVRTLVWTGHGYVLHGDRAGGRRAVLTAVATSAVPPSAALRQLGAAGAVRLEVPAPLSARPALATVTRPDGRTLLPTLWETSHRAAWRRLRDLVAAVEQATDLSDLDRDQLVVTGATTSGVYAQ